MEEALRHRQEYDEMVAEAKKRGMLTANNQYNSFNCAAKPEQFLALFSGW